MERVRASEVDTPEEVAKVLNEIVNNVTLLEGKLEQLLEAKPAKKAKSAKKGTKDA